MNKTATGLACMAACAVLLAASTASALLIEKAAEDPGDAQFTHFFPYPTTYDFVDERYAFDDDPLTAFLNEPYIMPIVVTRVQVRRSLVQPRVSFVDKMTQSVDTI